MQIAAHRANVSRISSGSLYVPSRFAVIRVMNSGACDIGLVGLAVMGQNLVLNMNDHGYRVAVFNRTVSKVDEFLQEEAKGTQVVGAHSIEELIQGLKRPRKVMLMVKAG